MGTKEIVSYVGGIAIFLMIGLLLRGRLPEEVAFAMGALAMLIVGFPFTRYLSGKQLTFRKWAMFSALGALAGVLVLVMINRFH